MKVLSLTGQRFGRLIAINLDHTDKHGKKHWKFQCDCGKQTIAAASLVKRGTTKSCGCLMAEQSAINGLKSKGAIRHGLSNTPEYKVWKTMRQRCMNPNQHDYYLYGGRGITVCERWSIFENFINDMGTRQKGLTIERINNDGNYEPSNCIWTTNKQQSQNRRPKTQVNKE